MVSLLFVMEILLLQRQVKREEPQHKSPEKSPGTIAQPPCTSRPDHEQGRTGESDPLAIWYLRRRARGTSHSPDQPASPEERVSDGGQPGEITPPSGTGYLRGEHLCQGVPPGSVHFRLLLTPLEVILCPFREKPCLYLGNRSFHSLLDMFPCKLNLEICLFRSFWEAEKRVPWGLAWGKGKGGLGLPQVFRTGSLTTGKDRKVSGPENDGFIL